MWEQSRFEVIVLTLRPTDAPSTDYFPEVGERREAREGSTAGDGTERKIKVNAGTDSGIGWLVGAGRHPGLATCEPLVRGTSH